MRINILLISFRPPRHGSIEENTTWDLVKDIEKLREELHVEKWHVFGGSWGSALSLAYAQSHPDRVKSLILRGVYTCRKSENNFVSQEIGASNLFPEAWDEYISVIPESQRHDTTHAYKPLLHSEDKAARLKAAKAWVTWEYTISKLYRDPATFDIGTDDEVLANALIECHYFTNDCWLRDGQLLEKQEIDKMYGQ
ncbi:hypothetical protein PQX77_016859 [Marasmius sp. AFHP31]|nr:hypothetical protein PQX77_016859 [Marasmius sp. AFHP31]